MAKMTINVPDNIMKFFEALSAFSGKPVKDLIEDAVLQDFKGSLDGGVCHFNISADDLKDKYNLTCIFMPEDEEEK